MIYRVQRTSARFELMFFLSLMTWVQIVESPMYPSDSFFDCVQAFEKAMTLRFSMIDVNKSLMTIFVILRQNDQFETFAILFHQLF